jgi:hypothetical protein
MTIVHIEGATLYASAATRRVSGMLLPFGVEGQTNLGRFTVDPGVFTIPADVSVLNANEGHLPHEPRARFESVTETPAGLLASFVIGTGPEGDDLLARLADPSDEDAPRMLSVEVHDVKVKAGKATQGKLFGAAFVKRGAFPGATLTAAHADQTLLASIIEDLDPDAPADPPKPAAVVTGVEEGIVSLDVDKLPEGVKINPREDGAETVTYYPEAPAETDKEPRTMTASAPKTFGIRRASATPSSDPNARSFRDVCVLLAQAAGGRKSPDGLLDEFSGSSDLFAALTDVPYNGTGGLTNATNLPQWVGELWSGRLFERRIVPLFGHADLTALDIKGWEWDVKPVMAEWAGNKAAVPSAAIKTKPATGTAKRYAGAHDIAREFRDFPNPEFWDGYFRAMTESYARLTDNAAVVDALAASKAVVGGAVPANIAPAMARIVDGALAVLDEGIPTFAVVNKADYRDILLTREDNTLAYLNAALGLEEGTIDRFRVIPHSSIPANKTLVGIQSAMTVHELPGSPIRTEALDQVKGGVDEALFGYMGTMKHDGDALALVSAPTV